MCVDEHGRCTGIVSLSDIFAYLSRDGPIVPRREGEDGRGALWTLQEEDGVGKGGDVGLDAGM